ncbi:SRPBCC family protein [Candidatus Methanoperedens nitratireducens]|uniref:Activator of Hsp90 ATPase homologue 1/2-like C-terminal domain-containing protein n=1 Tax=Candidatus Methanoperedens nitratireducens TaxID=1392998 RepID=A0A284VR95_9EURY|nr:SRPBCC domain-containing protein [Candidatus Methanoperedens nitroreducens]SNQ61723.1 hypothetical protein MNV_480018 [Candidatus Methanoperedens nitroreducens]
MEGVDRSERVKRWWGPKGFTSPVCKIDLRAGGEYLNTMRSPEGQEFWSKGVYREIVAPERLVRCRISRDCPYDKLDSSDSFKRVAERPFQANWGR